MQRTYDVCIIGAGVIGCAIARELARFDLSIAVFDKHSDVAEGTSKANSGIVHAGYDARPGSRKARYNLAGNRLFAAWCAELDVPYIRNTSLVLALAPEEMPGLYKLLERGRTNGVDGLSILGAAEVGRREPLVSPQVAGALLAETGGICSPYDLTIALAEHAAVNGVDFYLDCPVQSAGPADTSRASAVIFTGEGDTAARMADQMAPRFILHTGRGTFAARVLVNAAGVYADVINNQLSADRFTIRARRGEYWMLDKRQGARFHATLFQLPTALGKGVLVTPTVEQTLVLGPTAEDIDDKEDVQTTAPKLAEILTVARRTWPDIPGDQFITAFSGLRAHADRDDFILGEAPDVPGFFNAAGIESPGLTAAPAIGVELAGQIADRLAARPVIAFAPPPPFQPRFFHLDNPARSALIAENPLYGRIICRCEQISEAEIRAAIRRPLGARTVDGIKRRTRAGMGRCQGGFCTPRVLAILSEELGIAPLALTKFGGRSHLLTGRIGEDISPDGHPAGERMIGCSASGDLSGGEGVQARASD